ncbi:MAG: hypothetical protein IKY41_06585 [Clostridia bacterium]|nr:hypothetical protein [Clostridia bacterium]
MKLTLRILILVFACMMLFTSCAKENNNKNNENTASIGTTSTATPTPAVTETPDMTHTTDDKEAKTTPTEDVLPAATTPPNSIEVSSNPTSKSTEKPTLTPSPLKTPDLGNSSVVGSTVEADNAAKNIIKTSEKFNTTDNVFSALDDFWSNPKKFFLDEKYKTSYPLILIDLDQKTNGAHNQIRKFYNNTAIFFSLEDRETEMILNYYKNIAFDRSLALQFGIGLMSVRTTDYSDGFCIWIDEATLYTPYYLLAGGVWGDKIPMYPKMLEEMSSVKKSDTFLAGCVASKPSHCTEYIPGWQPLLNLCARYGDEIKNLNNHELVFSTPILTNDGYSDFYSGKVISKYSIPFYDKTSDRYGMAYFSSENNLIGIVIRE